MNFDRSSLRLLVFSIFIGVGSYALAQNDTAVEPAVSVEEEKPRKPRIRSD